MPGADPSIGWWTFLVALAVIAVGSFLVTYVATDLGRMTRTPYIALLTLFTGVLTWAYLWASGTGAGEFLRIGWAWGVLGAAVTGAVTGLLVRRWPATLTKPRGAVALAKMAWEGLVYGATEGTLLSILPVLAVWQGGQALGWTGDWLGKIGVGVLAMAASVLVTGIHHLGYREFRGPQVRYPIIACGFFSLAYLVTGSVIAPIGGHIVVHLVMVMRGVEMPPHQEAPRPQPSTPDRLVQPRTRGDLATVGR
jgi:hypothetical protein